ncbi:hypothetical protein [Proteus mirabilis]|uniref:tail fiber/spike domain-containing protein n=1 Tax=Proteus mirabilis TaxID=584 RepID=UPI0008F90B4B|nr:hypothetical protein [Proteus mirabilis]MDM3673766.1 hypothetical protein [Proteus mirabilis]MDM3797846.1 hypothetical protein [Proteus mirabilis]OIK53527.1 hypothetical protein BE839_12895 [Proteus mirabilis]TFT61035.1 hypothetical protein E4V45_08555 [Proteus mirabilis]
MTVSTELSHEEYVGNGVTTDFDFRFRIFEGKHLIVVVADSEGNETTLKNGTDYTIVGAGSFHGGKVVLNKPLAKGWKILLERDLPVVQETDLRNQGKFFAEVHEDAFDYLTMLIQKALGTFSLSLRKPTYLSNYYDAKGNRIANLAPPKLGTDAVNKDYVDNSIKDIDSKTLRVKDKAIPALPSAEQRRNKQLGFDNEGYPQLLDPVETGALGYVLVDSFEKGATLTSRYQVLFWVENREYFRWDGKLPKIVLPNSTPNETGGIKSDDNPNGLWISVGDSSLRSELSQERIIEWPRIGFIVEIKNSYVPLGVNIIKVNGLHLINWKTNGDFSKHTHYVESEPIKNEFDEYIIKTNNGNYIFVTQDIYDLRIGRKLSGWGYPSNDDFPSTLIRAINSISTVYIDLLVNITRDTVIDCTQIKKPMAKIISNRSEESGISIDQDCRLFLKTPENIEFIDVFFDGKEPESFKAQVRTGIWATNFTNLQFVGCVFRGFGDPIGLVEGTCALWLAAQETTGLPEFIATGNSNYARVTKCKFITTGDRTTNFGMRVYTPFSSDAVKCSNVIVSDSHFEGYNWNAVEFGGLGVTQCKMFENYAKDCGLTPFDLDKGCTQCEVYNCTVDGLRGNIDTNIRPNTNAVAWHIQGVNSESGYARNNKVFNCSTVMYLSDMIKYPNDYSLASSSFGYSNSISNLNLQVIYDIPKSKYIATKRKLYAFLFDTISDTKVDKLYSNLFTHGIFQFSKTHSNMYPVAPCYFTDFSSHEELTGEYINIQRGVSSPGQGRFIFEKLSFATNMSNASTLTPITFDVQGSSTHLLKVENSYFTTSGASNLVLVKAGSLCLNQVYELRDEINSDALISSGSQLSNIAVTDVYTGYGRILFDMVNLDVFVNQNTIISSYINDNTQYVSGDFSMRSTSTMASSPCAIPASRVRGTVTVISPLGISKNGQKFRTWINLSNIWYLSQEVL